MYEYRFSTDTVEICLAQLIQILDNIPAKLRAFSEEEFSTSPTPGKWSKKQIIGHLIDSATNNHHRFVRAQFDDKPTILYEQESWNEYSYYQSMSQGHIITFWEMYNRHIAELIKRIPPAMMQRDCTMSDGKGYTIAWVFEDYVRHLEHHLKQVEVLTP
jgi:hypothetical protein